ncbi:MAG: hypothetical protein LBQ18_01160 [Campylobacteraceae bacterium]|jgi:hypothetical protein|nr:hypothetical protein [Campylobacteraceae bacterium]
MFNVRAIMVMVVSSFSIILPIIVGFYSRGKTIDTLNVQANASAQAYALCEQKTNLLLRETALQNAAIEAQKIDMQNAAADLLRERTKMMAKWQVVDNATACEEKITQIDTLQKSFFKERQ